MTRPFEDTHRILALLAVALLAAPGAGAEPIALVADRIIDGRAEEALAATTVVVDCERIEALGNRDVIPADAEVIELPGTTLMPGMINAHYHSHDTLAKGVMEETPLETWRLLALPPQYPKRSREEIRARTLLGVGGGPHRIGDPGQYLVGNWQTAFAPHYAASFLGAAEAAYDYTLEHLTTQGKTGDPYVQQRVAHMSIHLETAHLWLRHVARLWDEGRREEAQLAGSRVRHIVEHLAEETVQHAIRACGARSLIRPSPLERILRDLTFYIRHDNDDQVLATIGKAALEKVPHVALREDGAAVDDRSVALDRRRRQDHGARHRPGNGPGAAGPSRTVR